ncbi:MAG: hypothetical protein JNJ49_04200, partial [Bdellovibrionaceae bacterium]|nr:hypothetical protein [Pseudobdellovibrionaceae bacterium]
MMICLAVAGFHVFRQNWPEVTLFLIFSFCAGLIYWLSSFKYWYGRDELRIENFLYAKTILVSEILHTSYNPHQNSVTITYGPKAKRTSFLVMGEQLQGLADLLQDQFPIARPFSSSNGSLNEIDLKMPTGILVIHFLLLALSIGILVMFVGALPTIFTSGIKLKDTLMVVGMFILAVCPFFFAGVIYSGLSKRIRLTPTGVWQCNRWLLYADLTSIEIRGLGLAQPNVKMKFMDGTLVKIDGWAFMKHPQLLEMFSEIVKTSERRLTLEASIVRGISKDSRDTAIWLSAGAAIVIASGIGTVWDQGEQDKLNARLEKDGVTAAATIVEQ